MIRAAAVFALASALGAGGARAQTAFANQTYSESEAARGGVAFREDCATCHGADLSAGPFGPALKGDGFAAHWKDQRVQALLAYLQTRMPPGAPGSLPSGTYGDIAAYILKANGAAAGPGGAAPPPTAAVAGARSASAAPQTSLDTKARAALAARKAKLVALTPVTDAMLAHPPEADWLIWRRTYDASGFSSLKQVAKSNVDALRQVWSWSLPVSQNETTPLVHDGVLFVASGNAVQALDAATGDLLWQYIRPLATGLNAGRDSRAKGLAIYKDRLFVPTADRRLVALDVHSGELIWDAALIAGPGADRNGLPQVSGAPVVAHGKVVIGVSLGVTSPGGCFIVAFDAETGREAWRFNTVDQRPPGEDSWNGAPVNERFGAGVWTSGSYDPEQNLLYFGVGNTYSAGTLLLPKAVRGASNDALYTDSTLALDPDTGRLVWHYQHMQRDVWDQDWVFEQTLATVPVNGVPRRVVVTAGKIAVFDVMDRATGKYLFSKDMGLQNLVAAIDPATGKKTINPALEPVSGKTLQLCPASTGARNWPATALDPHTQVLYVPMVETCSDYTWTARSPEAVAKGGVDIVYPKRPRPDSDGNIGRIAAVNLVTRQIVWTRRQRAPIASSILATAGGLVFDGDVDRNFSAFDAATGGMLWKTRLNASPSSSPITYSVGGEQFVAVVSGGGGSLESFGRALTPEVESPTGGTTLIVFKLPSKRP